MSASCISMPEKIFCLDYLPQRLLVRIAHLLSGGRLTNEALNLSESSVWVKNAVADSVDHTLVFLGGSSAAVERRLIRAVARPSAVTIHRGGDFAVADLRTLFTSASLQSVHIDDDPASLTELVNASETVTKLTVDIRNDASHPLLIDMLRKLTRVTNLKLDCSAKPANALAQSPLTDVHGDARSHLGMLMPQVEKLELTCTSDRSGLLCQKMAPYFRTLRQVTLHRTPAKGAMNLLRTVDVEMHVDHIDAVYHAERLRHNVVLFRTFARLSRVDLDVLATCTRLRDVRLTIPIGAEDAFAGMLSALPCLKRLHVWMAEADGRRKRRREGEAGLCGIIEVLAKGGPVFEQVRFMGFVMCKHEMEGIVHAVAKNVRTFALPIERQGDDVLVRLKHLLTSLYETCDDLRQVALSEIHAGGRLKERFSRRSATAARARKKVLRQQQAEAFWAVERLHRRFPRVNVFDLRQIVDAVL